jgi:hypothetical protein
MNVDYRPEDENIPKFYDNINEKGANTIKNFGSKVFGSVNPVNAIIFIVIFLFIILILNNLGVSQTAQQQSSGGALGSIIMLLFISLFVFLLLTNALEYIFDFNIRASVRKIFSPETEVDIELENTAPKAKPFVFPKEVFHISGNDYTYEDAKAVCKAFGSRLATYDEVENAYNKGGEWCSYGWSKGQMALFPTQKSTFDKLQKSPGHEHDCGRPGINGGFMKNPKIHFGVNCYGNKPEMTREEQQMMQEVNVMPMSKKEQELEEKTKYFKHNLKNILISPFNKDRWSKV